MDKRAKKIIRVTKTYLPDLEDYIYYLKKIWKTGQVTNSGPLVLKLENQLKKYLGVKYLFLVDNGTTGLQIAIKALDLSGEVITTPFSYVATTSSIVWEGCEPVFVDIDPNTLCIDANKIEVVITNKTSAILAVHVYSNVCDVELINRIAQKHGLKVIYDSAHAFSVKYKGKSVLNIGDINVLSFHATKIFHTGEGGAVITTDSKLAHKISYLRNFGHNEEEAFWGLGINGKNSELHAAMGLSVLPEVERLIDIRKKISEEYDKLLKDTSLLKPQLNIHSTYNYSYYPVLFKSEKKLLLVRDSLNKHNIFPRRYFYPSLNKLPYIKGQSCPIAENISSRILCLPLFHSLKISDVKTISKLIRENL